LFFYAGINHVTVYWSLTTKLEVHLNQSCTNWIPFRVSMSMLKPAWWYYWYFPETAWHGDPWHIQVAALWDCNTTRFNNSAGWSWLFYLSKLCEYSCGEFIQCLDIVWETCILFRPERTNSSIHIHLFWSINS